MTALELPNLPFPAFFGIETVRGCNASCTFCPVGRGQVPKVEFMADDLYRKIEAEILEHGPEIKRVTLNGMGEPLLDPLLESRIARLKDGGIAEVAFPTNAMLLTEDRAIGLIESGLDILRMSISTVNPDKYPKIRRHLDLGRVLANAENFFRLRDRLRPDLRIYLSMEKSSLIDDEDVRQWKAHWRPLVRPGDLMKVDVCFQTSLIGSEALAVKPDPEPCRPMFQTMYILYQGLVPLCCGDIKDGLIRCPLGWAQEQSLAAIWRGEQAHHYRHLHRCGRRNDIDICRSCEIWNDEVKENLAWQDVANG